MVVSAVLIAALLVIGGPATGQDQNKGVSPAVRSDKSGLANFGECHRPEFREIIESEGYGGSGEFSRNYNPSPKNSGSADCKVVESRFVNAELFGAIECLPEDEECLLAEGYIFFNNDNERPPAEPPGQQFPLPGHHPCERDPTLPECQPPDTKTG